MFPSKHCCLYIPTNYKCFHCHQHEEHPRCQVARWRRKSPWQTSNSSWPGLKTQLNIGFHFWFSFVFLTPMTRLVKCPTRAMYLLLSGWPPCLSSSSVCARCPPASTGRRIKSCLDVISILSTVYLLSICSLSLVIVCSHDHLFHHSCRYPHSSNGQGMQLGGPSRIAARWQIFLLW